MIKLVIIPRVYAVSNRYRTTNLDLQPEPVSSDENVRGLAIRRRLITLIENNYVQKCMWCFGRLRTTAKKSQKRIELQCYGLSRFA